MIQLQRFAMFGFCALLGAVACGGGDEGGGGGGTGAKDAGTGGKGGTGGKDGGSGGSTGGSGGSTGGASGSGGASGGGGAAGTGGSTGGAAGSGGTGGSVGGAAGSGGSATGGTGGTVTGGTGGTVTGGTGGTVTGGTGGTATGGTGGTATGGTGGTTTGGTGGTATGGTGGTVTGGTGGTATGGTGGTVTGGTGGTATGGTGGGAGDGGTLECVTDGDCANTSYCDGVEKCIANKCTAGAAIVCPDDGKSCTTAVCDELSNSCKISLSDAACDDAQFCNGIESCDPANAPSGSTTGCKAGTAVNCNDNVSCTTDSCDEANDVCAHSNNSNACGDGLFCNGVETCAPGTSGANATTGCVPGNAPDCTDNFVCTADSCDETNDVCAHVPNNTTCQDGLYCNGAEVCSASLGCQPGTAVSCPNTDGLACTVESCNEATDTCDTTIDNTKCTGGQICIPPTGCVTQACVNDGQCSDGNACNGTETCDLTVPGGQCKPGVAGCVTGGPLNDGVACTLDECNPATGACTHTPFNAFCSDGNVCNGTETCNASTGCQGGTALTCNDQKSCTIDTCISSLGCFFQEDDTVCQDSSTCNGTEACNPAAGNANATTGCVPSPGPLSCGAPVGCVTKSCVDPSCKVRPCSTFTTSGTCTAAAGCAWSGSACIGSPTTQCSSLNLAQCSGNAACFWNTVGTGCVNVPDDSVCNYTGHCGYKCDAASGQCGNTWCKIIDSQCQGKNYACGDCIDNDGDCKVDSQDESCLGTCSDNESGFKGEIPGQNNAACKMDCYFDADSGAGNDDCNWDHRCDGTPGTSYPNPQAGDGCAYDANFKFPGNKSCADYAASQSTQCAANMNQTTKATGYCGPLVPNGCDCFGCCVFPQLNYGTVSLHGTTMNVGVYLGSGPDKQSPGTCNMADILAGNPDPANNCHKCVQVPSCSNTCDTCEICVGKPTLPPSCSEQSCPTGQAKCGLPGQDPCPTGQYCVTGCCVDNPS